MFIYYIIFPMSAIVSYLHAAFCEKSCYQMVGDHDPLLLRSNRTTATASELDNNDNIPDKYAQKNTEYFNTLII